MYVKYEHVFLITHIFPRVCLSPSRSPYYPQTISLYPPPITLTSMREEKIDVERQSGRQKNNELSHLSFCTENDKTMLTKVTITVHAHLWFIHKYYTLIIMLHIQVISH